MRWSSFQNLPFAAGLPVAALQRRQVRTKRSGGWSNGPGGREGPVLLWPARTNRAVPAIPFAAAMLA